MKKYFILWALALSSPTAHALTEEYIAEPARYIWAEPLTLSENYDSKQAVCSSKAGQKRNSFYKNEQKAWRFIVPQNVVAKMENTPNASISFLMDRLAMEITTYSDPGSVSQASIQGSLYLVTRQGPNQGYVGGQTFPTCFNNNESRKTNHSTSEDCSINAYSLTITPQEIPNLNYQQQLEVYIILNTQRTVNCTVYTSQAYPATPLRTAESTATIDFDILSTHLIVSYDTEEQNYQGYCQNPGELVGSPEHDLTRGEVCSGMCEGPTLLQHSSTGDVCGLGGPALRIWIGMCEADYFRNDPNYDFWQFYFEHKNECGWSSPCDIEAWQMAVPPDENGNQECAITCEYDTYLDEQFCNVNEGNHNTIPGDEQICTDADYNDYLNGNLSTYQFCLECDSDVNACLNAHCPGEANETAESFCHCLYADGNGNIVDRTGYEGCVQQEEQDCEESTNLLSAGTISVHEYCTSCSPDHLSECIEDYCPDTRPRTDMLTGLFPIEEEGYTFPYTYSDYQSHQRAIEDYCNCVHNPEEGQVQQCIETERMEEPCSDYSEGTTEACACMQLADYPRARHETCLSEACGNEDTMFVNINPDEVDSLINQYCSCSLDARTEWTMESCTEIMYQLVP